MQVLWLLKVKSNKHVGIFFLIYFLKLKTQLGFKGLTSGTFLFSFPTLLGLRLL
jgi:hypothetical protein